MKKEEVEEIKEKKNKKRFHIRLLEFLFKRPILKFVILLIIQFITLRIPEIFHQNFSIRWVLLVLDIVIIAYFIIVIIHVFRISIKHLMNPRNLFYLIGAYILLILVILFVASMLYNFADLSRIGYIQYGNCSNQFNPSTISNNPNISSNFFYFSAVTFFTVGYGDICPMGFARIISIIVAFIGHIISVFLVAFIVNNYLQKRKKTD